MYLTATVQYVTNKGMPRTLVVVAGTEGCSKQEHCMPLLLVCAAPPSFGKWLAHVGPGAVVLKKCARAQLGFGPTSWQRGCHILAQVLWYASSMFGPS